MIAATKGTAELEQAQHHRQESAEAESMDGETEQKPPVPAGNTWRMHTVDELTVDQGVAVP